MKLSAVNYHMIGQTRLDRKMVLDLDPLLVRKQCGVIVDTLKVLSRNWNGWTK